MSRNVTNMVVINSWMLVVGCWLLLIVFSGDLTMLCNSFPRRRPEQGNPYLCATTCSSMFKYVQVCYMFTSFQGCGGWEKRWKLVNRCLSTAPLHESLIISEMNPGGGPRRSCRIKYQTKNLELSATGIAQDEVSAEEFSTELHENYPFSGDHSNV